MAGARIAALVALQVLGAKEHVKRVAVLDLAASGAEVSKDLAQSLSLLVPDEVRRADPFASVISQSDVTTSLNLERQKQLLGCAEDNCMAELAGALGADEVVSGHVAHVGHTYLLELRRFDANHKSILGTSTRSVRDQPDALLGAIKQMVPELYSGRWVPGCSPIDTRTACRQLG